MKKVAERGLGFVQDESIPYDENRDFTSLEAWKKAREVKLFVYRSLIPLLPKQEAYNLAVQIRKAAISCTANIAEGYGRFHYQEGIQFYRIARASAYELKDHLISCLDLNYIGQEVYNEGISLIEESKRTLNGYIAFVKKQRS